MDKKQLRQKMKVVRGNITNSERKSALICQNVKNFISKMKCEKIFTYVSMPHEVDTKAIIMYYFGRNNYSVFVPFVDKEMSSVLLIDTKCLETDKLGNLYNKNAYIKADITPDIALVPLLCFNSFNYRLGYGGGYYDKYLSKNRVLSVGIAFDEQLNNEFKPDSHDVPLDYIITATNIYSR